MAKGNVPLTYRSLAASMTKRMREAPENDPTFGLGVSEKGEAVKDLPQVVTILRFLH